MSISKKLEQVTRAILPAFDHIPDKEYRSIIAGSWARTAIEAMLEPTDDMIIAGDDRILEHLNNHEIMRAEPTPAQNCFRAMIKVALE